ncbi:hypothetical protein AAG570_005890 [Ranatra chinensis]|uniref:Uncharacterized protein n=1 Tax=Ranatra chinensis TaxID=642074 RepID=A0ABD0XZ28_9HEMI
MRRYRGGVGVNDDRNNEMTTDSLEMTTAEISPMACCMPLPICKQITGPPTFQSARGVKWTKDVRGTREVTRGAQPNWLRSPARFRSPSRHAVYKFNNSTKRVRNKTRHRQHFCDGESEGEVGNVVTKLTPEVGVEVMVVLGYEGGRTEAHHVQRPPPGVFGPTNTRGFHTEGKSIASGDTRYVGPFTGYRMTPVTARSSGAAPIISLDISTDEGTLGGGCRVYPWRGTQAEDAVRLELSLSHHSAGIPCCAVPCPHYRTARALPRHRIHLSLAPVYLATSSPGLSSNYSTTRPTFKVLDRLSIVCTGVVSARIHRRENHPQISH